MMCNTYQRSVDNDCPCRYTFKQVGQQMLDESATFRWVVGGLLWLVGQAFVLVVAGTAMALHGLWLGIVWALHGVWLGMVWAYNAVFPVVNERAAVVAPVVEVKPVVKLAKQVGIAVVDWPTSKRNIVSVEKISL